MRKRGEDFAVNLAASAVWTALSSGAVGALVTAIAAGIPNVPVWAMMFAGLVAGVLVLEGLRGLRARPKPIENQALRAGGKTHFERETVRLRDVVNEDGLLVDKTFIDCTVIGPAVLIAQGEGTVIDAPTFIVDGTATEDAVYIKAKRGQKFTGFVGVKDCLFRRCRFIRVALVVSDEQMQTWKREGRIQRTHVITETAQPEPEWSVYNFLRDRHRDAVRIINESRGTTDGAIADLSAALGRLSGETVATLKLKGHDAIADDLEPLGPPRHLASGGYDRTSALNHQYSVLREFTARLAEHRDKAATPGAR